MYLCNENDNHYSLSACQGGERVAALIMDSGRTVVHSAASRHLALKRERPGWQELSRRFGGDRECLAVFLALETAEILAGAKPANLINVANKRRPCGKNLYELWKKCGASLLGTSGLAVKELADRGNSLLLLIYRPDAMAALLARKNAGAVLRRAGYREPSDPAKALSELHSRMKADDFPHEIGVFLGYPLKDVAGFMGWVPLPFTCQGPWKIYGDPCQSLRLAETFRSCRERMAERLTRCNSPFDCFWEKQGRGLAFAGCHRDQKAN